MEGGDYENWCIVWRILVITYSSIFYYLCSNVAEWQEGDEPLCLWLYVPHSLRYEVGVPRQVVMGQHHSFWLAHCA